MSRSNVAVDARIAGSSSARRSLARVVSPTPRAALALAAIGLLAIVLGPAVAALLAAALAGAILADALAARRPLRAHAARRRRSSRAASRRRSRSRSPATAPRRPRPPAAPGRDRGHAAGGRRRPGRADRRRRRGSFALPAAAVRVAGPLRPRDLGPPRRRGRAAARLSRPAVGAAARARRAHGALPRVRPPVARPARPRDRVRVDPRLPPRRRHPPGQLAGDRAHGAADEQPVPHRAGPRRHLRHRLRPPHGRAAERRRDAPGRRRRRRDRRRPRRRRARRPLRDASRSTARSSAGSRRAGAGARRSCARSSTSSRPPIDSDYELAFRTVASSKRALVIVFTDLIEEVAARSLIQAVPVLARRHEVVVAGVVDPDLDAMLATRPTHELDVYRAAAALDVLAARERAAARVRGAGAQVLETAPGDARPGVRRRLPQREGARAAVSVRRRRARRVAGGASRRRAMLRRRGVARTTSHPRASSSLQIRCRRATQPSRRHLRGVVNRARARAARAAQSLADAALRRRWRARRCSTRAASSSSASPSTSAPSATVVRRSRRAPPRIARRCRHDRPEVAIAARRGGESKAEGVCPE